MKYRRSGPKRVATLAEELTGIIPPSFSAQELMALLAIAAAFGNCVIELPDGSKVHILNGRIASHETV